MASSNASESKDMILCAACCRKHRVPFALDGCSGNGHYGGPDKLVAPGGTCRLCGERFTGEYAFISRVKRDLLRQRIPRTEKMERMDLYEKTEGPYMIAPTKENPYPFIRRVRGPAA